MEKINSWIGVHTCLCILCTMSVEANQDLSDVGLFKSCTIVLGVIRKVRNEKRFNWVHDWTKQQVWTLQTKFWNSAENRTCWLVWIIMNFYRVCGQPGRSWKALKSNVFIRRMCSDPKMFAQLLNTYPCEIRHRARAARKCSSNEFVWTRFIWIMQLLSRRKEPCTQELTVPFVIPLLFAFRKENPDTRSNVWSVGIRYMLNRDVFRRQRKQKDSSVVRRMVSLSLHFFSIETRNPEQKVWDCRSEQERCAETVPRARRAGLKIFNPAPTWEFALTLPPPTFIFFSVLIH